MPPALAERCILAGSAMGDEVLDPFLGSGTTGMVAEALGRRWHGVELSREYEPLIKERTAQVGLFGGDRMRTSSA
jgi:site-specific DNA-methyltransferase (cytosine-N4-specific)